MSWITPFLLGRPGFEIQFEVPPEAMSIDDTPIAVYQRNLVGDLKKSVLKASAPIVKIKSSYLSINQRNQFASLPRITDTFLAFITRTDWAVISEYAVPIDNLHLVIQNTSATKLSALYTSLSLPSIITITNVTNSVFGSVYGSGGYGGGAYMGTDYWTGFPGGTYNDATRTITLASPLPNLNPLYVTYTYTGWGVNVENLSHSIQGGWVDRFNYDFMLTGI